jgi:hypothetical protein
MQYIDALLFSSLLLLTIPTTGFVSWFLGIEGVPDKYTIIGGSILLVGIGLITYSEHQRNSGKLNLPPKLVDTMDEDPKISSPPSPHSIVAMIQMTPIPTQYHRLQQVEEDDGLF